MTHEEIFSILDKNLRKEKKAGLGLMIAGGILFIPGIIILLVMAGTGAVVLACCFFWMGGLLFFAGLYKKFSKKLDRQTAFAKEVLINNPKELVWIYVYKQYSNGALNSVDVILNFRNKTNLKIAEKFLPDQNANEFMKELRFTNPNVYLGFSKELKYKYRKGLL
jgi:hypothetical protein